MNLTHTGKKFSLRTGRTSSGLAAAFVAGTIALAVGVVALWGEAGQLNDAPAESADARLGIRTNVTELSYPAELEPSERVRASRSWAGAAQLPYPPELEPFELLRVGRPSVTMAELPYPPELEQFERAPMRQAPVADAQYPPELEQFEGSS